MTVYYGTVGYAGGIVLGLKALLAAVAGGIGSVPGAFLGGLLLGCAEALWSALFPIEFRDLAIFTLLVVLLVVRPSGLFGFAEPLPTQAWRDCLSSPAVCPAAAVRNCARLGSRGGAVMTRPAVRAGGCKTVAPAGDPGKERQGRDGLLVRRARKPGLQCGARMPRLQTALDYPERLGVRAPLPSPAHPPSADARRAQCVACSRSRRWVSADE